MSNKERMGTEFNASEEHRTDNDPQFYNRNEKKQEYDALVHSLCNVRNLTDNSQKRRDSIPLKILSRSPFRFFEDPASRNDDAPERKSFTIDEAEEIANVIVHEDPPAKAITENELGSALDRLFGDGRTAPKWADGLMILEYIRRGDSPEGRQRRIDAVYQIISHEITFSKKPLSFSVVALMSEINSLGNAAFPEERFAQALDKKECVLPLKLINQLSALIRANHPQTNVLAHKVMDFVSSDIKALQNFIPPQIYRLMISPDSHDDESDTPNRYNKRDYTRFAKTFVKLFTHNSEDADENYLIQQHLEDIAATAFDFDEKRDAIKGIAGSAANETIYTYQNIYRSYKLRLQYGITQGNLRSHMVLPLGQGYLGMYRHGNLEKIFDLTAAGRPAEPNDRSYASMNDPSDNYIYSELNSDWYSGPASAHLRSPSQSLSLFDKRLRDSGRTFFFDLDQVGIRYLHPFVAAEILDRNLKYIQAAERTNSEPPALSKDEYLHRLFPAGGASEETLYIYQYLMRLGMRKSIEDNLRIDMGGCLFLRRLNF